MGSFTKAVRDVAGVAGKEEIQQRLDLLLVAAKGKIRAYRDEINEQFMNPALVDKIQIPGIRSIRFIEQYHVAAKSSFNQQVSDHLTQAIDAFFSIGGNQITKTAVQNGIKALISTALDAFIGGTEAGESEEKFYVVVPENNAFVRADIFVWKYHMTEKSLGENSDSAVAYVMCKSVIDHTKITIDELIYLVSDALAQRPLKHFVMKDVDIYDPNDPAKKITIYKKFRLDASGNLMLIDKNKSAEESSNWQEWLLDDDNPPGGTPPSIGDVEAYIEELIKVWKKLKQDRGD